MIEQKDAYVRVNLPGAEEIFNHLPRATERIDRISELKIRHMATGLILKQTEKTINHNLSSNPVAPSTALIISSLYAASKGYHSVMNELFEEIERLRLLQ